MKISEKEIWKDLSYDNFFDYLKAMANIQEWHRFIKKIRKNYPLIEGDYEQMVFIMKLLPQDIERLHKKSLEIAEKLNNDN